MYVFISIKQGYICVCSQDFNALKRALLLKINVSLYQHNSSNSTWMFSPGLAKDKILMQTHYVVLWKECWRILLGVCIFSLFSKLTLLNSHFQNIITESQNCRHWKGPLKIIKSNSPAKAASLQQDAQVGVQMGQRNRKYHEENSF